MTAQTRTTAILFAAALLFCGGALASLSTRPATPTPTPLAAVAPATGLPSVLPRATAPGFGEATSLAPSTTVRLQPALSHPALLANGAREAYLMVKVSGDGRLSPVGHREPVQLALVLDCSGSMEGPKLEATRAAAREVVRALLPGDRLVVVTYETSTDVLLPSTVIDERSRAAALSLLEGLRAMGSTNLAGGLARATAAMLADPAADHSVRRMVLLSDGQANVGEVRVGALLGTGADLRNRGIALSTVGVGLDFNGTLMEGLAEHGGGRYRFMEEPAEIAQAFATELRLASQLVAADVKVVLHPADGVRVEDVYGHLFERSGDDVVVKLTDLASTTEVRVLARLSVTGTFGARPVVEAVATFADVASDRARVAARTPALVATFVDDPAEVERQANKEVLTYAINGRSIAEARRAMELYNQGRQAEALASIDAATHQAQAANVSLNSKEILGSVNIFGNLRALFSASANSLGGEEVVRTQRKAIKNFGSNSLGKE